MNKTHTKIQQITKFGAIDAHIWLEHNGKIIDYTDKELKSCSCYGTDLIVRKEFPIPLQIEVLKLSTKIYKKYTLNEIIANKDRPGNCVLKAFYYKKENPDTKIKIGSLGFIQKNNKDIFYEYG